MEANLFSLSCIFILKYTFVFYRSIPLELSLSNRLRQIEMVAVSSPTPNKFLLPLLFFHYIAELGDSITETFRLQKEFIFPHVVKNFGHCHDFWSKEIMFGNEIIFSTEDKNRARNF